MLTRTLKIWLGVFVGLAAVGAGLYALLWSQRLTLAANTVAILATLAVGTWTLRGLYVWREVTWVRRVNSFVIAAFAFGLVYLILHAAGASVYARSTLYLFAAVAGFMLGINLLRLMLIPGWPILGVARNMIEEAIRMKVALIFIVLILIVLPAETLLLVGDDRLTYTVQRFLTYSLIFVSFKLSVMTAILATYTTSNDIKSKMAHMSLTKPISRPQYLLGKWLGIVLLNAVLLGVSGIAIVGLTHTLADGQAMNDEDRETLSKEVLTARISQIPSPIEGSVDDMVQRTLAIRQERDPDRYGEVGSPASALPERVFQEVFTEALAQWFTIGPRDSRTYLFSGLAVARENADRAGEQAQAMLIDYGLTAQQANAFVKWQNYQGEMPEVDFARLMTQEQFAEVVNLISSEKVQFAFNPYTKPEPDDGMVVMGVIVNGLPWPIRGDQSGLVKVAVDAPYEMPLPAWLISDEGTLEITILVPPKRLLGQTRTEIDQTPIQLNRKDAVPEVFYRVGTFEGNVARSMAVLWIRLAFIAMFGLMLGAMFSFPVACLAALLVYIIAAFSGFLSEAVSDFSAVPDADTTWGVVTISLGGFFAALGDGAIVPAIKLIIGLFAKLVMLLIPSFGEFNPGPALADGKIVPTSMLLSALLRIGLLWTGVVTAAGLFLFSRREIARVTV